MKIAGLIKQSYIDYPGKMAAVVFTQGCNFRCGYCHNPSLVLPRLFHHNKLVAVSDVLIHLENRKDWLDGVVITGGEPTIHGDLPDFLRQIKSLGYLVKLDTNGSNPLMLEKVIKENLVDFIAMDIKTLLQEELYAKSID
jgi:pyruvate formate lyase activating enzyme